MNFKEDHIFLQKLAEKHMAAYQYLYEQYYRILTLYAMKFVDDQSVAEDMVQDLFINIWEQGNTFINISAFKSYLYNSIRNSALNHIKHLSVKEKYAKNIKGKDSGVFDLDLEIEQQEIYKLVYQLVESLPDKCREVFELHLQGKKNSEIAEVLKISVETVKTHKKRAIKKIKSKVDPRLFMLLLPYIVS